MSKRRRAPQRTVVRARSVAVARPAPPPGRAARTLPPSAVECGAVLAAVLLLQGLLLAVDPGPYFFSDSGAYLYASTDLVPRRDRPLGISVLYAAALAVSQHALALVVVQTLLMAAAATFAYATVRELGRPRWAGALVAAAVALSPSSLLFQRLLLAESLAALLLSAIAYAALRAVRLRSVATCAATGGLCALLVLTKTSFQAVPVALVLALALLWRPRSVRALVPAVLAVVLAAGLPLLAYSRYSAERTGLSGLSPWAGMVLFARTAPLVDCSRPEEPPAVRAAVCADGVSRWTYNEVLYRPGFVASVLGQEPEVFAEDNRELQDLAVESVREEPVAYAESALRATAGIFGLSDPDAVGYTALPSPFTVGALEQAGVGYDQTPRTPLLEPLVRLSTGWFAVRWLTLVAVAVACWRVLRRRLDPPSLVLGLVWLASVAPLAVLAGPFSRYAYPLEAIGWVLAAAVLVPASRVAAEAQAGPAPRGKRRLRGPGSEA